MIVFLKGCIIMKKDGLFPIINKNSNQKPYTVLGPKQYPVLKCLKQNNRASNVKPPPTEAL